MAATCSRVQPVKVAANVGPWCGYPNVDVRAGIAQDPDEVQAA